MFICRFHDAGYYFWKLSVQCLDLVSGAGNLVTSIAHLRDYVILLPDRILQTFAVMCKLGLSHLDYHI